MKVAYICSPFSGNVKENLEFAKRCGRFAVEQGYAPLIPHLYLPQFMSDEAEREKAMQIDVALLKKADEVWVCGTTMSKGMQLEWEIAQKEQIFVRFCMDLV